jgi:Domain of unknown function (DUF4386)
MSQPNGNEAMNGAIPGQRWKDLYRVAGIVAAISIIVILLSIVSYFFWPYAPGSRTTEEIFLLLRGHPLGGLISLDFLLLVGNLLSIMLFLALYVSLKPENESYALIALVIGLVGVVLLIPARPILELFALSKLYASATTEVTQTRYLAAGESLLAMFDGTGWFANTLLGALSLLISSLLMLRSRLYSRATAFVGIVTNAAVCGFFLPGIGIFLLFLSLPGYMIWYFLLARRFFQLSKE